jgi:hypothetical protein
LSSYVETRNTLSPSNLKFDYIEDKSIRSYIESIIQAKWFCDTEDTAAALLGIAGFVERLNQSRNEGSDAVIFLAVTQGSFPSIEYIAEAIKCQRHVKVLGIYVMSHPPTDVYDDTIFCGGSLYVLAEILKQLPSKRIYLQAHGRWSYLSQFIKSVNPCIGVIHEVYDWMESFIGNRNVFISDGLFTDIEMQMILESEKYIRNHTDGYIYKDGGEWMRHKVETSRSPSIQVLPCAPMRLMKKPESRLIPQRPKLVYAGQVRNNISSKRIFGDLDYIELVRELTGQGAYVTVYNSVFYSRVHPVELYDEYVKEAENNDLFDFMSGIPVQKIINEMHGRFDYGMLLYYFEDNLSVGKNHLKGTMASKLFTYLASGIPVLVSEELDYMASFVKKHGVGIVLSRNQIPFLIDVLSHTDYEGLLQNVQEAQTKYNMERYLPRICDLLRVCT